MPKAKLAEFMTAIEAGQCLARRFGGLTRARQALAIGLREGVLTAAAESTAICQDDEDEFAEKHAGTGKLLEIAGELWTHSEHWEADVIRWDWEFGDFEIENLDTGCSYLFNGVHFLVTEIDEIDASSPPYSEFLHSRMAQDSSVQSKVLANSRGPKPSVRWTAVVEAVLQLERDGELITGKFEGPGALKGRLQELIPENQQLADRTIEDVASYIFRHLLFGAPAKLT